MKRAVIIYGPPGSGKGTQAELLARKFGLIHFDTGRFIDALVHSSDAQKDPVLRRERKLFDVGTLCTPSWVLSITQDAVRHIAKSDSGIVFSGSPRTFFEAIGEGRTKNKALLATLEKFYGKENIAVVKLNIREETSLKRNSARLVCSVCGFPLLAQSRSRRCAFCAGPMRKRTDDKPSVIRARLKQYRDRTYPIVAEMKKRDYRIIEVNGEPLPYKVSASIARGLSW